MVENTDFIWIKEYFKTSCVVGKKKTDMTPEDVIGLLLENNNNNISQNELETKYHVIVGLAKAISIINREGYKDVIKARPEGHVTLLFGEDKFNRRVLLVAIEGYFINKTHKS